eukprot:8779218-Pyramimonas_sp.AAC.1
MLKELPRTALVEVCLWHRLAARAPGRPSRAHLREAPHRGRRPQPGAGEGRAAQEPRWRARPA